MKKFLTIFLLSVTIFVVGCSFADHADKADQMVYTETVELYDVYFDVPMGKYYIVADGWAIELEEMEITNDLILADHIQITYDQNDTILAYEWK